MIFRRTRPLVLALAMGGALAWASGGGAGAMAQSPEPRASPQTPQTLEDPPVPTTPEPGNHAAVPGAVPGDAAPGAVPGAASTREPTDAGETRAAVAREIRTTLEQLQQVRAAKQQARMQHGERLETLENRIAELKRQLGSVRAAVEAAERRRQRYLAAIRADRRQAETLRRAIGGVAGAVHRAAAATAKRVRTGIPQERATRAAELNDMAKRAAATAPSTQAKAAGDFFRFLGEALPRARTREHWYAPVHLGSDQRRQGDRPVDGQRFQGRNLRGRRVHARQLRIGLVSQMFVGEAGQPLALATMQGERPWRLDLSPTTRQRIRRALAMSEQRSAPRLHPTPMPAAAIDGTSRTEARAATQPRADETAQTRSGSSVKPPENQNR